MITAIYDSIDGDAIADGKIEEYVEEFVNEYKRCQKLIPNINQCIITGNFLVIEVLRKFFVEGKFDKLELCFKDEVISVDKFGELSHWPKGFGDHHGNVLRDIMNVRRLKKLNR